MSMFRKKAIVIEARQLTREDGVELAAWSGGQFISLYGRGDRGEDISHIVIPTLGGDHRADLGDWIIRGVKGEFYPCKPDIFDETYYAISPSYEIVAPVKTSLVENLYELNERFRCEHSGRETAPFLREAADEIMRLLRELGEAAACHQAGNTTPSCNVIKVPTSADEAAAMALIGHNWLKANAPDRVIEALEPCEAQEQADRLHSALGRASIILSNMATEHETGWRSIFARWPIHHEPLRADARSALPQINAALEDWEEARG